MHILVTRPEADAASLAAALEARGHTVSFAPMMRAEFLKPEVDFAGVTAVAVTSRNAIRAACMHPQREQLVGLPLFTVGPATAAAAREAGFGPIIESNKDGAALAGTIVATEMPEHGTLLHLAGDELAFDLGAALAGHGIRCRSALVYRMTEADRLPDEVRDDIGSGAIDAVVLMSPRTARIFAALVKAAGLAAKAAELRYLCLSDKVRQALSPLGVVTADVAIEPNSDEILALVDHLSSRSSI